MLVAGLYAGIGGFELGFERSGHRAVLMSEVDPDAMRVIQRRFCQAVPDTDVVKLPALPEETEVVTAGFPCQNLSMAGDKSGVERGQDAGRQLPVPVAAQAPRAVGRDRERLLHAAPRQGGGDGLHSLPP